MGYILNSTYFAVFCFILTLSLAESQIQIQSQAGEPVGIELLTNNGNNIILQSETSNEFHVSRDGKNILEYNSRVQAFSGDRLDSFVSPLDLRVANGDLNVSSLNYLGQEQWRLHYFNDFQTDKAGWSQQTAASCGTSSNVFLGGHCNFADHNLERLFEELPKHTKVMVKFNFHFLDDWNGETAYAKIDDKTFWQEAYTWCSKLLVQQCKDKGVNTCGKDTPDRLAHPVSFTFQHSAPSFKLLISTSLSRSPCEASWGIDDVQIYLI